MKPTQALKEVGPNDWETLAIGLRKGRAEKSDVAEHALVLLSNNADENDEKIALLAIASPLNDREVDDLLRDLAALGSETDALEKWRLAALVALRKSDLG